MAVALLSGFLFLLAAAGLWLVLQPGVRGKLQGPLDTKRLELEEERDLLVERILELDQDLASGLITEKDHRRLRLRYRTQTAQLLEEIADLPPPPPVRLRRFGHLAGPLAALAVAAVIAAGAFSFFPAWQQDGLSTSLLGELRSALTLKSLAAAAKAHPSVQSELAWGNTAFSGKHFGQAAAAYSQVLRRDPKQPVALRRLGLLLLGSKFSTQGEEFIAASVKLDPKAPEGYLFLGDALSQQGHPEQALRALRHYRHLRPASQTAAELIAGLHAHLAGTVDGFTAYTQSCQSCHGIAGQGGSAPALIGSALLRQASLFRQVVRGGAAGMPAFSAHQLPSAQLSALLAYLRKPR